MKCYSMHYGNGSSLITGSKNNKVVIGSVCVHADAVEGVLRCHNSCNSLGSQKLLHLRLRLPWRSVRAAKELVRYATSLPQPTKQGTVHRSRIVADRVFTRKKQARE